MTERCDTCNRVRWDGGGALADRLCDEPGGALCRAVGLLYDLFLKRDQANIWYQVKGFLVEVDSHEV